MRILAVDPGDVHCGVACLETDPPPHACDCLDTSSDSRMHLRYAGEYTQASLFEMVVSRAWDIDRLVIERFRLYPWLARQQGFSDFLTCEAIGVLKYLASAASLPVVLQDASGHKRNGRAEASSRGFAMEERRIGKGKHSYFGPDFTGVASEHARDACAHAVDFAVSNVLTGSQAVG